MTEPEFPKLHVGKNIKIEEIEYVSDELVPTLQFNISVSKEALQDHSVLWLQYFKDYNDYRNYNTPTPDVELKKQIIAAFVHKFEYYLWNKIMNEEN